MEEKLRELTFGKAVLFGLIVAAVYYFALYNSGADLEAFIQQTRDQVSAKEAELTTIKNAIADAERLQTAKKNLGEELDVVLKAIPEQLTNVDLMRVLSNEAKSVGVNILSINTVNNVVAAPQTTGPKPFFAPVAVTVSLEGSYNQLMLFLSNLTKTDRIITVSALNLQLRDGNVANADARGPTLLKMSGEFKAYKYLPATTEKGASPGG